MRVPNDTERLAIFGKTGTGKTHAALWWLQQRSYDRMPWTIIDYKGDPLVARIPGLNALRVTDRPPRHAGLYVIRPFPDADNDLVDAYMMSIWEQGRHGVFLDEGYMIGRFNNAYKVLLTQGRSKRVPVITLSQRPAWISPFILSESEYVQSFYLRTPTDQKRVSEFMPGANLNALEKYQSYYYNVADDELTRFNPVPDMNTILNRFDDKRARRRWPI